LAAVTCFFPFDGVGLERFRESLTIFSVVGCSRSAYVIDRAFLLQVSALLYFPAHRLFLGFPYCRLAIVAFQKPKSVDLHLRRHFLPVRRFMTFFPDGGHTDFKCDYAGSWPGGWTVMLRAAISRENNCL
jgi:hypothetical protein